MEVCALYLHLQLEFLAVLRQLADLGLLYCGLLIELVLQLLVLGLVAQLKVLHLLGRLLFGYD